MPVAELSAGLVGGALAVLTVGVVAWLARRGERRTPPLQGGVALTAAALAAMSWQRSIPIEVVVAVAGIGAAVALGSRPGWALRATAAAPFAAVLAADASPTTWTRVSVGLGAIVGALGAAELDRGPRWGPIVPTLYATTVAGVFAAVPDTEEVAVLLGAALPMAALAWSLPWARLGRAGAASATGLLLWTAAVGGRGRPPSIVGSLACLGLLAAVPALDRLRRARPSACRSAIGAVLVHGASVLVAARLAGISRDLEVAIAFAVLSSAMSLFGAYALRVRDVGPAAPS